MTEQPVTTAQAREKWHHARAGGTFAMQQTGEWLLGILEDRDRVIADVLEEIDADDVFPLRTRARPVVERARKTVGP